MSEILELKIIQYMKAIEEEGSFQKASEALFISQPALSQYIKRVEQELSFPLYERRYGKCILTDAGKILLTQGTTLLEEFDHIIDTMKHAANIQKSSIGFGCPTGYSVPYFSEFLCSAKQYEQYQFNMVEDSVEYLISMLLKKKLDIIFIPAVYSHPNLLYYTICHEEYYLAVPKNHALNQTIKARQQDGYIRLSDLEELPFISGPAKAYTEFLRPLFEEADTHINTIFVAKNWDIAHSLVEKNVGLTIVPYWFAHSNNPLVDYYKIRSNANTHRIFSYAVRSNHPITEQIQIVIDYIIHKCGDSFAHKPIDSDTLLLTFNSKTPLAHEQEE